GGGARSRRTSGRAGSWSPSTTSPPRPRNCATPSPPPREPTPRSACCSRTATAIAQSRSTITTACVIRAWSAFLARRIGWATSSARVGGRDHGAAPLPPRLGEGGRSEAETGWERPGDPDLGVLRASSPPPGFALSGSATLPGTGREKRNAHLYRQKENGPEVSLRPVLL